MSFQRRATFVLAGLVVGIEIGFVAGASLFPSCPQQNTNQQQQGGPGTSQPSNGCTSASGDHNQNPPQQESTEDLWLKRITAAGAVGAAIATSIYVVLTRGGNQIARDTLIGLTRPWMGVDVWQMDPIEVGRPVRVNAILLNGGNSPALKVESTSRITIAPGVATALASPEPQATRRAGYGVVFPRGTVQQDATSNMPPTEDNIRRLRDGQLVMVIRYRITYEDTFGTQRRTEICQVWDRQGGFGPCDQGNYAD
jgi:hypothetical protein